MSKVNFKEVQSGDMKQASIAHFTSLHSLAQVMDIETFIYCSVKFQALITNLQSMILCAMHAEKDIYYKIKKSVEAEMKDFIETHDEYVEKNYKKKIKGKN